MNDKQWLARSSGATKQSQSNHNNITCAVENTTRGMVLGADFSVQYSLQIVNLGNDVIQNVIIIYTDILDSLRASLAQELNKTAKFNQCRSRRNYRAQGK